MIVIMINAEVITIPRITIHPEEPLLAKEVNPEEPFPVKEANLDIKRARKLRLILTFTVIFHSLPTVLFWGLGTHTERPQPSLLGQRTSQT
jgi:hypothetical protein